MRILNDESNEKLDSVILFLTESELNELLGCARQLLERPSGDHHHICSKDYQKQITICIYNSENTKNFDARSQKLILEDK